MKTGMGSLKRGASEQKAMIYMYENAFMKLVFCAPFLVIQIETVYVEKDTLFRPEDGI